MPTPSEYPSQLRVTIFPCILIRSFFLFFNLYCMCGIIQKVPYEDLLDASELLIKALTLRQDYCHPASHSFPSTTSRFLYANEQHDIDQVETIHEEKKTVEGRIHFMIIPTILFQFSLFFFSSTHSLSVEKLLIAKRVSSKVVWWTWCVFCAYVLLFYGQLYFFFP